MKRGLVVALVLMLSMAASFSAEIGAALDLGTVQDLVTKVGGTQFSADVRVMLYEDFQVRIPVSVTAFNTRRFVEGGVILAYYPWHRGPFMGLSLFQLGFSSGCPDLQNMVNLNEVLVGWTFPLGKRFFVEGSVSVRDPSGTFSEEYSQLKGTFPCYTSFRGHLTFGWNFWRINE